ncbi:MAG: hypothetical protein K2I74_03210 [Treponemataceae bacterium]|nr:hypothetical protein [Treponemataceae bacterium]
MKKYAGISAAIVLICAIASVPSCIVEESYNGIDAPTVYANEKQDTYFISFAPVGDMLYANVFREESIDGFDSVSETLNIGQVIPRDSIGKYEAFTFEDAYVGGSDGTEYRYFIRYWDNAKYTYSNSSKSMPSLSTDKSNASLTANDGLEFLYVQNDYDSEKTYTLFLQHDVTVPTDFEEVHVIIGIDGQPTKKPFLLASRTAIPSPNDEETGDDENDSAGNEEADGETKSTYTVKGSVDDIVHSASMNLHTILPAAFRDRKLTVDGIIGVHKIGYKGDDTQIKNKNYTNYYWTTPILLPKKTIQYAHKDDDDKGTWTPGEPEINEQGQITRYYSSQESTFVVPSIQEPQNDFDYSDANRSAAPAADNAPVADGMPSLDVTPFRP